MSFFLYIFAIFSSLLCGYLCARVLASFVLPYLQKRESIFQQRDMLSEANRQRDLILEEQKKLQEASFSSLEEDLEDEIALKAEDLKQQEKELEVNSQKDLELEDKLLAREEEARLYQLQVEGSSEELEVKRKELEAHSEEILMKMSQIAGLDSNEAVKAIEKNLIAEKLLEIKKEEKQATELLSSLSNKNALRMLDRVLSRYSPEFYWPKPVNLVDVSKPEHVKKLSDESCRLLKDLEEISGVTVSFISDEDRANSCGVKVVGGYGIAKEASRLTLENLLSQEGTSAWGRFQSVYDSYFEKLSKEAQVLGLKAVEQLQLKGVHPELQKLVGALNWRTSYRQNQWYHTVEVATLAGILAHEMGEDTDAAKRVGLLHDVGKVLDYKINVSHAIISGDYADLYGEKRFICDALMSHHADLIVETPLAYILQTADCLSGARPGARVNLEEGYQIRLSAIQEAVHSFPGIADVAIMNGGREVHVQVVNRKVPEKALPQLAKDIAKKIEEMVNYPGKIKVMVTRIFESVKVA